MKRIAIILAALLVLCCTAALAENQYYYVETPVEITDNGVYTAVIQAGTDGWEWSISENKDITSWLVTEDNTPAFADESGIAHAHLVYGPLEGAEGDVALTLEMTIDMSKVTGFAENGAYDLYFRPQGKDAIWAAGNNHGQYVDCSEKLGTVNIPAVTVDGKITGTGGKTVELDNNTAVITLAMDGLDVSLIDASAATVEILEGDGYYPYNFSIDATLSADDSGALTMTVNDLTGSFGMQGGDGNGHYNMRIGVSGITYNGIPMPTAVVRTDIYAYGRTFLSDHGSLIWYAEPEWTSTDEVPELCDVYPDEFFATWPVGMDASAVTADDVTITLISQYDDELVLTPGTDYIIEASSYKTKIVTTYIYWAYAPVYTTLRIEINTANVVRNEQMYADTASFSHDYEITSVYAYNEMGGGLDGAQGWTYYGFANLTEPSQVFYPATYTLTWTDADGAVWYYGEDESGNGILVAEEADGISFNCDEECNVRLVNQLMNYTRVSGTENKTVNGEEIEFTKRYVKCEVLPRSVEDLDESLELLPGYTLGSGWEDHLKWPWQSFINIGYMSDNK